MADRLPFIDSDAHVIEPVDMFEKYLEPKFRDRMPYACADYQGEPLAFGFELMLDDQRKVADLLIVVDEVETPVARGDGFCQA